MGSHKRNQLVVFAAGAALGLLVGIGMLIGSLSASHRPLFGSRTSGLSFPETLLNATATHSSENFAIATGQIDEYSEGLFMLDSLTGDLQCVVINSRTAKFDSFFKTNVIQDLQVQGKKPQFLLVTGGVNFRTSGTTRPAATVAYVVEANSGRYAAYGVPLSGQTKRAAQFGKLPLLDVRDARSEAITE